MKGFTLIELLAVIVILAIVLLISVPLISNVISEARKKSFELSSNAIVRAVDFDYNLSLGEGDTEEVEFNFTNGVLSSSLPNRDIKINGKTPEFGKIKVTTDGQKLIALHDGEYCAYKNTGDIIVDKVPYSDCVKRVDYMVKKISAGLGHTLFLLENGDVYATGRNIHGQLGLGNYVDVFSPTKVETLSNVKDISAGFGHSLVLLENGDVYSFGRNTDGELGRGNNDNNISVPMKISSLSNVKSIYADATAQSMVILDNGDVYAFGSNNFGQLGLGDKIKRNSPTKISSLSNVKTVSLGMNHSMVVLNNGDVYTFGANTNGELGLSDSVERITPVKLQLPFVLKKVSSGWGHTLMLSHNNEVYSFGANQQGALGHGDLVNRNIPTKIILPFSVKELTATNSPSSFIISEDGDIYSFGSNFNNLGFADTNPRYSPTKIILDTKFNDISVSFSSAFAISKEGEIFNFGGNSIGKLGTGNSTDVLTPTVFNFFKELRGE